MIKEMIKSPKGFGSNHNGKSFVLHLGGFVTQLQKVGLATKKRIPTWLGVSK
jgi:hypothetical protein